ncbi:hypothetical protein D3C81_1743480 [compost metagenome]
MQVYSRSTPSGLFGQLMAKLSMNSSLPGAPMRPSLETTSPVCCRCAVSSKAVGPAVAVRVGAGSLLATTAKVRMMAGEVSMRSMRRSTGSITSSNM